MSFQKKLGIESGNIKPTGTKDERMKYINFKLAAMGLPPYAQNAKSDDHFIEVFDDIIKDYREKTRRVDINDIGIHKRINMFFSRYFEGSSLVPRVVENHFTLDHYGLAREMSLPPDQNEFANEYINSYRIKQGILNNPKNDRRTTKG